MTSDTIPRYRATVTPSKHINRSANIPRILPTVSLTKRQRHTIEAIASGRETGLTERDKTAVLAQIVEACQRAGAETALIGILGLDMISLTCALTDCIHRATRPGGKDQGEVADYSTRHAAIRTALEWTRKIGTLASKTKQSTADRPQVAPRKGRAAAALTAAPELDSETDSTPDSLPAS